MEIAMRRKSLIDQRVRATPAAPTMQPRLCGDDHVGYSKERFYFTHGVLKFASLLVRPYEGHLSLSSLPPPRLIFVIQTTVNLYTKPAVEITA
ncbi:hypothetical protein D3C84_785990 [compost metagenome]